MRWGQTKYYEKKRQVPACAATHVKNLAASRKHRVQAVFEQRERSRVLSGKFASVFRIKD